MPNHNKAVEALWEMCRKTGIEIAGRPDETIAIQKALVAVFAAAVERNQAHGMLLAVKDNRRAASRDPRNDLAPYDEAMRNAINHATDCSRKLAKKMSALTKLVITLTACTVVEISDV